MEEKRALRQCFLNKRSEFHKSQDLHTVRKTLKKFLKEILPKTQTICAIYHPRKEEIGLRPEDLSTFHHIQWVYPKMIGDKTLNFYESGEFELNSWDVLEPKGGTEVSSKECAFIFFPGVAFDVYGGRLGSGQGFYDRSLQSYKGIKVGLCYSVQISKKALPQEDHDIVMDTLITEKQIFNLQKKRSQDGFFRMV